jgi:hypothetical protein
VTLKHFFEIVAGVGALGIMLVLCIAMGLVVYVWRDPGHHRSGS